jgi:adenosylhomocysteinase
MPRLQRVLAGLPDLRGMRLACSMHLDVKIIPLVEGFLNRQAEVFLVTCNPSTVRDRVVDHLAQAGAAAQAWYGMSPTEYETAIGAAVSWQPTHLCEFGADLTMAFVDRPESAVKVRASLEGTSSGMARLEGVEVHYPVINWNDLPVKEGLHNRHMVGLATWQMFFNRTQLSLHEKRVAVIGYGSVGQGVANTARAFGGAVTIVERDPGRAIQAAYDGWPVNPLDIALPQADVIVTATGARHVINANHWSLCKPGSFLLNVGHSSEEIDIAQLYTFPNRSVLPFIEEFDLPQGSIFLIAGGSMANLAAGSGDSLNAFDLTLSILAAGIGYMAGPGSELPAGISLLPRPVWLGAISGG